MYAVLAGVISLPRTELKARVIDGAEVLAVFGSRQDSNLESTSDVVMTDVGPQSNKGLELGSFDTLNSLVKDLYESRYAEFFVALADVEERFLRRDRVLAEHRRWYVRELRRRAYAQLLESYKTVGIKKMANDFGVTVDFLDR